MNKIGISLGWNCNSAIHGVQNGIRMSKKDGYLTCPFDEMVTNLSGLIKCLHDDFKYFCDDAYLTINTCTSESEHLQHIKNDNLIHNTYYNFIFNHESPGHANLYLTQQWSGGIDHYVKDNYKEFKNRYNRRINNFLNYINDPNNYITFIIHGYSEQNENITELKNVLNKKYPNLKYELYILPVHYDKNIIVEHYKLMNVSNDELEKDLDS
jgi:hypothetical protein